MSDSLLSTDERNPGSSASSARRLAAIILAAGKGTRMMSDRPKVVHEVANRPMIRWVVDAVRAAGAERIILVIGHGAEEVRQVFADDDSDLQFVVQERQDGTGHATLCAAASLADFQGDVAVLAGDGPLIRPETLTAMRERHQRTGAAATLATSVVEDPTGYGRVVRDEHRRFVAIVEHKNASERELAIHEIYPSYACFDKELLFRMLEILPADRVSGEYYLTEVPAMLKARGLRVELIEAVPPEDVLSINTPEQLKDVESILYTRMGAPS